MLTNTDPHILINFKNGTRAELGVVCLGNERSLRDYFATLRMSWLRSEMFASGDVVIDTEDITMLILMNSPTL